MRKTVGYATESSTALLKPFQFERRDVGAHDVAIDILYCGICHSDLHQIHNDWKMSNYPMVPGHEIVGRVTEVGSQVKQFQKGALVGVGCLVDSCQTCHSCKEHLEQFCEQGATYTYNSEDKISGGMTYGGYSKAIVVHEHFVLRVPEKLNPAAAAPLLCAGITTYSPLRRWNVHKGHRVGIVGLGGLGHMAVKIAKAMGAHVVLFTTSYKKEAAGRQLGADEVVISTDAAMMAKYANSLHFILDTVSAQHDLNIYLELLVRDGSLTQVGLPSEPIPVSLFPIVVKRLSLTGSLIGGIKETQEMLDFCAKHNIVADIEIIPMQEINEAMVRLAKSDVKYRFVIDMASLT